ncbi:hypothetical protein MHBO_003807 [Bonamia ostreae]|uniref:IPO4/5-like TPR repeats domain-containing protein n=1 Tax=Bonamia ostreae TaxID=126728 RepID=A0ABV2ASB9_9EUKA
MQQNQLRLVETLIENIQSPDESVRSPAELQLEKSFTENGSQALMLLGQVSAQSTNSSVRSMSFIVMRRNLIKTDYEVYNKLPEDGRNGLKKLCLGAFEKETEDLVRRQLITFISEIAELELPRNGWPQLFPELARFTKSQNILLRGDAYLIFGDIANITDLDENQMKGLKAVFANGLSDGEMGVRLKSFGAVVAFSTKAADSISKVLDVKFFLVNYIFYFFDKIKFFLKNFF